MRPRAVPGRLPGMSDAPSPAPLRRLTVTPLGGLRHSGAGAVGPSATLVTLIGGLDLDLRAAPLPAELRVTKVSLIGGVSLAVACAPTSIAKGDRGACDVDVQNNTLAPADVTSTTRLSDEHH